MDAGYEAGQGDRRQRAARWPIAGPDDDRPGWYRQLLVELAGNLTAWKREHDPRQHLDPRMDPRCRERVPQRRYAP